MKYRDAAVVLAAHASGDYLGIVVTDAGPHVTQLVDAVALGAWYSRTAGAPMGLHYVAIFDKTRSGTDPVAEVNVQPEQPGLSVGKTVAIAAGVTVGLILLSKVL